MRAKAWIQSVDVETLPNLLGEVLDDVGRNPRERSSGHFPRLEDLVVVDLEAGSLITGELKLLFAEVANPDLYKSGDGRNLLGRVPHDRRV